MTTLCLDLGTKTGFAVGNISGSINFKPTRFESAGIRFVKFKKWLYAIKEKYNPTAVFYEEVRRHSAVDAAHIYGGFVAVLQSFCLETGTPYTGVNVQTIKKHMTGKGGTNKQAVIEAVQNFYGKIVADDNEADALALKNYVDTFHLAQMTKAATEF